jgi:hypothetical protein
MHRTPLALLAALPALILASADARACGGCFHGPAFAGPESTVVVGHRMAVSVSSTQTVLWDQIQYSGSPTEFAWVLPVRPGARLELGSDAWFDTLDAATTRTVNPPTIDCTPPGSGAGCASTASTGCAAGEPAADDVRATPAPGPVSVVHHGSTGPYESVVLHGNVPDALPTWLTAHGYAVPEDVFPIIDAYAGEGFDFIALRLLPDQGVQQMKPVRVIQAGASPTLPLRMVAAGTGPTTAITLFVIGEGRWTVQGFPEVKVDLEALSWDFNAQGSNYATLRADALATNQGRSWIAPFAQPRALLAPVISPVTGAVTPYQVGSLVLSTLGEAYVEQALTSGETSSRDCADVFAEIADSGDRVVDPCAGGTCGAVAQDEIDARTLACAPPIGSAVPLADLAVALTGMHPRDVWLTRLEATLPRAALASDLTLQAAAAQVEEPGALVAAGATGTTCQVVTKTAALTSPRHRDPRVLLGVIGGGLALLAAARRLGRARPARALGEVKA